MRLLAAYLFGLACAAMVGLFVAAPIGAALNHAAGQVASLTRPQ